MAETPPTAARPPSARRLAGSLAAPLVAMVLLIVALGALLWRLDRSDADERRTTLIGDMLWLEQNLRFQLAADAESLRQLADDLDGGRTPARFGVRGGQLLHGNPEFVGLTWIGPDRGVRTTLPAAAPGAGPTLAAATLPAVELATGLGHSAYGGPYRSPAGDTQVDLVVPLSASGRPAGAIVASISLESVLRHFVPWWFAQRYQLRVLDDNGAVVAAKSSIEGEAESSYRIPFDPPGNGLVLEAAAYRTPGSATQRLLLAAIVALAAGVLLSLWTIRGQLRRRLAAEQALRAEHAFRKAMGDSLFTGLVARDRGGRITYVNPAFCRMVGFDAGELVGTASPAPFWTPEDSGRCAALLRDVAAGTAADAGVELTLRRKDGRRFPALVYEAPLIDADGGHAGWMGSVLDITARKEAEELARQQQEKLEQTARLTTMGEMASTLAHELNQPLAAIASYNAGCINKLASGAFTGEELATALTKVGKQAERAGRIIRRVHDFVRKREPKRVPCRFEAVVEDAVALVEVEAKKRGVRIIMDLEPDLPPLVADPVMLEQVLVNLLRNGIEAMAGTASDDRRLDLSAHADAGHLTVRVADRGPGIAPEVAGKLFSPFFTTKPEGMGMGLSICRSIVEFHGGRLGFEPNPGGGTVFAFTLPLEAP